MVNIKSIWNIFNKNTKSTIFRPLCVNKSILYFNRVLLKRFSEKIYCEEKENNKYNIKITDSCIHVK